jgi:putative flippase GtrA
LSLPGYEQQIHKQLVRFLLVGGLSFVIDITVMALLIHSFDIAGNQTGLILARVVAWSFAIVFAFFTNAAVTFGASIRRSRFFSYLLIQGIGASINLGSYSALVIGPLSDRPLLALMIGSGLATVGNFLLVRKFVYRFHPSLDDPGN